MSDFNDSALLTAINSYRAVDILPALDAWDGESLLQTAELLQPGREIFALFRLVGKIFPLDDEGQRITIAKKALNKIRGLSDGPNANAWLQFVVMAVKGATYGLQRKLRDKGRSLQMFSGLLRLARHGIATNFVLGINNPSLALVLFEEDELKVELIRALYLPDVFKMATQFAEPKIAEYRTLVGKLIEVYFECDTETRWYAWDTLVMAEDPISLELALSELRKNRRDLVHWINAFDLFERIAKNIPPESRLPSMKDTLEQLSNSDFPLFEVCALKALCAFYPDDALRDRAYRKACKVVGWPFEVFIMELGSRLTPNLDSQTFLNALIVLPALKEHAWQLLSMLKMKTPEVIAAVQRALRTEFLMWSTVFRAATALELPYEEVIPFADLCLAELGPEAQGTSQLNAEEAAEFLENTRETLEEYLALAFKDDPSSARKEFERISARMPQLGGTPER